MHPEVSLEAIAEDWLLICVVIVQQLFFSSVSSIPSGPNKVILVNKDEEDDFEKAIVCTEWKG